MTVVLVGVAAGFMSGLLGIGGGIVMVPLLVAVARASQHEAHATSLGAIIPIAVIGAAVFAFDGEVDVAAGAGLAAGALLGAPIGAALMARTSERGLRSLFGLLTVAVGVSMVLK